MTDDSALPPIPGATVPDQPTPGASVPRAHLRRLPTPTTEELARRSARMAVVSARHLGPFTLERLRLWRQARPTPAELAVPLRLTYEELGGSFLKFGQIIASSPALFGEEVADEFRSTLDTGPPVPLDDVRRQIEDDLGMDLEEAYAEFDPVPIGRASIAVVHRARLHDGREVAVKVIRPGIERLVATDLHLMHPFFELLARQTGDQMLGSALQLLEGFRRQLGEEMDLRNEARAMAAFRALLSQVDLPLIVVPEPVFELSGADVLTMELLDGVPIDDPVQLGELGVDPGPLVEQVVRASFLTTVRWGAFHGDVHAGNLLVLRDGRMGIIDWGIVGRLDPETHRFFLRMLAAVLGEEQAWTDVTNHLVRVYGPALQQAVGLADDQLTAFVRSLIEPILTRPFGEVSMAAIFQTTEAQLAKAQGVPATHRTVRGEVRRLRHQRRVRKLADEAGGLQTDFDRGNFLLGKQLMYFERYGRLYLKDTPLLSDRQFFVDLLAAAEVEEAGRIDGPAARPVGEESSGQGSGSPGPARSPGQR